MTERMILLLTCLSPSFTFRPSDSSHPRASPSFCSERTHERSHGPSSAAECTRRVSLRRLPRSALAGPSSTSVPLLVPPLMLLLPDETKSQRCELLLRPRLSPSPRRRRSKGKRHERQPRPRARLLTQVPAQRCPSRVPRVVHEVLSEFKWGASVALCLSLTHIHTHTQYAMSLQLGHPVSLFCRFRRRQCMIS